MRRMIVLLAILLLGACDRSAAPSAPASAGSPASADSGANSAATNDAPGTTDAETTPPPSGPTAASKPDAAFTNRVWVRPGEMNPLGSMKIFLGDGTLLSDSCFETYRLSQWRSEGQGRIAWQEDGVDIHAEILNAGDDELVLQMQLAGGSEQHRFVPAQVPYLCPDVPR